MTLVGRGQVNFNLTNQNSFMHHLAVNMAHRMQYKVTRRGPSRAECRYNTECLWQCEYTQEPSRGRGRPYNYGRAPKWEQFNVEWANINTSRRNKADQTERSAFESIIKRTCVFSDANTQKRHRAVVVANKRMRTIQWRGNRSNCVTCWQEPKDRDRLTTWRLARQLSNITFSPE